MKQDDSTYIIGITQPITSIYQINEIIGVYDGISFDILIKVTLNSLTNFSSVVDFQKYLVEFI